jgi:hypothetical protein
VDLEFLPGLWVRLVLQGQRVLVTRLLPAVRLGRWDRQVQPVLVVRQLLPGLRVPAVPSHLAVQPVRPGRQVLPAPLVRSLRLAQRGRPGPSHLAVLPDRLAQLARRVLPLLRGLRVQLNLLARLLLLVQWVPEVLLALLARQVR